MWHVTRLPTPAANPAEWTARCRLVKVVPSPLPRAHVSIEQWRSSELADVQMSRGAIRYRSFMSRQTIARCVVPEWTTFPRVCLKCGSREGREPKVHEFHWKPLWVMVVQPFGGAILASLLGIAVRRHAKLRISLCDACERRARFARVGAGLGMLVLLSGMVIPYVLQNVTALAVMLPLGLVGTFLILELYVHPRIVRALRIEEGMVTLDHVHVDAVAALDAHKRDRASLQPGPAQPGRFS